MTVDTHFRDRASFGPGGVLQHTELVDMCPERGGSMNGSCHTFTWDGSGGFTGTFWSIGTVFDMLEGREVESGAMVVRFVAWGRDGGEIVEFGAGIDMLDAAEARREITLTTTPTVYGVDVTALSNSEVFGAFMWAANDGNNPMGLEFYVDDIQWSVMP